ncbi:MAG: DUF4149 domain-containing protein [Pseudomonadota bacterium]
MYHLTEAYLLATFIALVAAGWGALVAGGSLLPVLFQRTLPATHAGRLLRAYWPNYFKFAMGLGLVATLVSALAFPFSALPSLYVLLLTCVAAIMTSSFFAAWSLIPHINAARDDGDNPRFARLHRYNLLLTAVGLVCGTALLGGMIYVLPGQFTFWPTLS